MGAVSAIEDLFSWELNESNIFLGFGFGGVTDKLSMFNKFLSDIVALQLYQLKESIKSILWSPIFLTIIRTIHCKCRNLNAKALVELYEINL